jgi:hypothetical protein
MNKYGPNSPQVELFIERSQEQSATYARWGMTDLTEQVAALPSPKKTRTLEDWENLHIYGLCRSGKLMLESCPICTELRGSQQ